MERENSNQVYIESLVAMMKSLESSHEFKMTVQDETLLLRGLGNRANENIEFAGYLNNDGKRRLKDISDTINRAVDEIGCCDSASASAIYLDTLKQVLLQTRFATILEMSSTHGLNMNVP